MESPPLWESLTRWLVLLTTIMALGGWPYSLLVWQPALKQAQRAGGDWGNAPQSVVGMVRQLTLIGAALSIATNSLLWAAEGLTQWGYNQWMMVLRVGLWGGVIWLAWKQPHRQLLILALGGLIALTISLTSHSAAIGEQAPLAIVFDWLHLAATIGWAGGWLPLLLTMRLLPNFPLTALIPRFSRLALMAVLILAISGLNSFGLHVGQFELLPITTYGVALILKTILFAGLMALGAVNWLWLSPRLRALGNQLAGAFRRTIRVELGLGIGIIVLVGVMTSVATSASMRPATHGLRLAREAQRDDQRVAPQAVDVSEARPNPLPFQRR